ncbi:MAG: site-specific integrase [Clostridia bacterium]|nr:site-specific integrase [Clostridia bacterium]
MQYKDWLNTWLEIYVKPTVKMQTYARYKHIAQNHISKSLGEFELGELSAIDLQRFIVELSEVKRFASNTVNSIITVIRRSMQTAVSIGLLDREYSNKICRPKTVEKEVNSFSVKEQRAIEKYVLQNLDNTKLFGIVLCLYTGLRIGELLALKWESIDLSHGIIFVNSSCHDEYKNGKLVKFIDAPKTKNSIRIIPIPKQIMPYLKRIKRGATSEYIVSGKKEVGVRSYQKTFECVLRKLNIPHKGFHSLRHTFAMRAIESGMDVKTLSELLGHKNPDITLKRYTHSMLDHKREMMNVLGKKLVGFCDG